MPNYEFIEFAFASKPDIRSNIEQEHRAGTGGTTCSSAQ